MAAFGIALLLSGSARLSVPRFHYLRRAPRGRHLPQNRRCGCGGYDHRLDRYQVAKVRDRQRRNVVTTICDHAPKHLGPLSRQLGEATRRARVVGISGRRCKQSKMSRRRTQRYLGQQKLPESQSTGAHLSYPTVPLNFSNRPVPDYRHRPLLVNGYGSTPVKIHELPDFLNQNHLSAGPP
jgi:hypothetical protein